MTVPYSNRGLFIRVSYFSNNIKGEQVTSFAHLLYLTARRRSSNCY